MGKFTLIAWVRASQMAPETLTCHQAFFFFLAEKESRWMSKVGKSSSLKEKGKKGIAG